MPLRRFLRQYEQLSQFERGRIIGMFEAGWSARRVAHQLGRFDCVVRRRRDQWIREMSFTRRPGPRRPRQTSLRADRHIVRNACVQPTASSAAIQAQVEPSLGAPLSSRTTSRCLAEGYLVSRHPLRVLPMAPSHRHLPLEWCRTRRDWTATEWNQVAFSDESRFNLHSNDNRVRLRRPRDERLNPALLYSDTPPTAGCDEDVETWMACDAEYCGFQMLNDDEIVTSVQEESNPVDDKTDEDEDNNNDENSKSLPNADAFSALETAMEWYEKQSERRSTQLLLLERIRDLAAKNEGVQWYSEK
ncbi:transposable element Tcb2 transposase [Trichonephila clavipes]|nr:transposable element Tcb2 transposase [Trichonephila clavipes]